MQEVTKEMLLRISGADVHKCMRCGKCSASCPAYDAMEYHPHQFVSMVDSGDIQPLLVSDAAHKCLSCFACMQRCPRDVKPAKLVEAVRVVCVRRQNGNRLAKEAIPQLLDIDLPQQAIVSAFRKYTK